MSEEIVVEEIYYNSSVRLFIRLLCLEHSADHDDPDQEEYDSEDEYMYQYQGVDTARIEEVPAKEPVFNAVPLKSALKKRNGSSSTTPNSNPGTPVQEHHTALGGGSGTAGSSNARLIRQGELK